MEKVIHANMVDWLGSIMASVKLSMLCTACANNVADTLMLRNVWSYTDSTITKHSEHTEVVQDMVMVYP